MSFMDRLGPKKKEDYPLEYTSFQEGIVLPLHIVANPLPNKEDPFPIQLKQKEILLPRFLAEGGSDVYCLFSPALKKWQLIVINRHLVAKEGMQVLFFNHLTEEYAVIPFEELPSSLEKTDPAFKLRQADLEDMYLGVVIAVCQRIENFPPPMTDKGYT